MEGPANRARTVPLVPVSGPSVQFRFAVGPRGDKLRPMRVRELYLDDLTRGHHGTFLTPALGP